MKTQLVLQMEGLLEKAQNIIDEAKNAKRPMTDDEYSQAAKFMGEAMQLQEQIKQANRDEELKAQLGRLFDGVKDREEKADGLQSKQLKGGGTPGEQFLMDPAIAAWRKSLMAGDHIPDRARIASPTVWLKGGLGLWQRKELITGVSPTSAGAFITAEDTGIYEPLGRYPRVIRDLISVRQTGSDTVEFVRQTRQITEAAPTAEANIEDVTGATGEISGTKPQGRMNFERIQEVVKTIAVWVGATRRALSDASQMRGIIDQELREDLDDELESQVLTGTGVGENFTGLANYAGTLTQAFGVDILTTTRRAITTLLVTGRQVPTAWLFSPTDWETVELIQDNDGRYYHGGPLAQGPMRLWGVPVAQSFHQSAGSAWLANWRKAVLWDRERVTISMTDSHEDWFVRNMIAVLGEMRAAFGLIRPSAFIEVELS